jgi:hypothetical protein
MKERMRFFMVKSLSQGLSVHYLAPFGSVRFNYPTDNIFLIRFNELRRVRNKEKTGVSERPFSRMHNFFVLASGEKWARTGTKFRPLNSKGFPDPPVRDHSLAHKVLFDSLLSSKVFGPR